MNVGSVVGGGNGAGVETGGGGQEVWSFWSEKEPVWKASQESVKVLSVICVADPLKI